MATGCEQHTQSHFRKDAEILPLRESVESVGDQFGDKQYGFVDLVQPIAKGRLLGFKDAVLNVTRRFEYVDWNVGIFQETGGSIADDYIAIVPALSFRPTSQTIIRLNYRRAWQQDLLGNPPANIGGIQFGISSYF